MHSPSPTKVPAIAARLADVPTPPRPCRPTSATEWIVGLALVALGCGEHGHAPHGSATAAGASASSATYAGTGPLKALCTTGMVADLVRTIGGPEVQVTQLMGEGVDPHLYKPSPSDVRALTAADIVFYSGLHLEGKMADVLEQLGKRKRTLAVAETIPRDKLLAFGENYHDPHVWFDVALWSLAAQGVGDALAAFDPAHAETYRQRTSQLRSELAELDAWCRAQIASIPREQRVLVTAHDAFHYFGRAYDLEVKAIQGVSTETEAGVKEINELVEFLARRKIKAVFVETSVSERNIQALVEGCKARGHQVRIGGELYSDAMGEAGTPAGTYAGMVRHNVMTIVKSLQ